MRRRWRSAVSVLVMLFGVLTACGGGKDDPTPAAAARPNVVFLVVDDLDQVSTPVLDAMPHVKKLISDRGTTFRNSFATDPVCCPARATLLTGMYPHNTHVFNSEGGYEPFKQDGSKKTIGVRMQRAGYTTAFMGKYLNGYELDPSFVPPGWDEWFGLAGKAFLTGFNYQANHNGTIERYGKAPRDYQTDVIAEKATAFVDSTARTDKPFLLTLFPTAPHGPLGPAPRDRDNPFADDEVPARPNIDEADISDKPMWLRDVYGPPTPAQKASSLKRYRDGAGSLIAVDDMVGRIASRLKANGQYDNTVFVFASDNGYSFGSHRLDGKVVPYDEATRVPLIIAGPGIHHGTVDGFALHIDMAPTLYDLAGMDPEPDVDGRSLRPMLRGEPPSWRDDFLIEYRFNPKFPLHTYDDVRRSVARGQEGAEFIPDYRALRNGSYLYIEWYSGDEHEYELYDTAKDPYQLTNLMADPTTAAAHRDVVEGLQQRLEELGSCSGSGCR